MGHFFYTVPCASGINNGKADEKLSKERNEAEVYPCQHGAK